MTGRGGWPMTVFLTPDGRPFYGGTYFPPERPPRDAGFPPRARGDRAAPGETRADEVRRVGAAAAAAQLGEHGAGRGAAPSCSTPRLLDATRPRSSRRSSTRANGGFGGAPKFPQPMTLEFLLRCARATRRRRDALRHGRRTRCDADGARRHLRPARRRLPSLLGRRALAGAALREDAVRQRAARPRLPARVAG